jgi:superfamily II DNA/RNA helicase
MIYNKTTLSDKTEGYASLIAQSKNGSGKTGSFVIGSILRVDPDL